MQRLRVLQPLPIWKKVLTAVRFTVSTAAVHPEKSSQEVTQHQPAQASDAVTASRLNVPAFSKSQMDAAKTAQRNSMMAYSLQVIIVVVLNTLHASGLLYNW